MTGVDQGRCPLSRLTPTVAQARPYRRLRDHDGGREPPPQRDAHRALDLDGRHVAFVMVDDLAHPHLVGSLVLNPCDRLVGVAADRLDRLTNAPSFRRSWCRR